MLTVDIIGEETLFKIDNLLNTLKYITKRDWSQSDVVSLVDIYLWRQSRARKLQSPHRHQPC